jgi:hypothetical protein
MMGSFGGLPPAAVAPPAFVSFFIRVECDYTPFLNYLLTYIFVSLFGSSSFL